MNVLLISEVLKVAGEALSLIPEFSEKRKREIQKELNSLYELEKEFNNFSASFKIGSSTDELLGISDQYNLQANKIKDLMQLYAKELMK